jgi:hypothetical protein
MNSWIVCLSSTHGYWWTLVVSVCLLLTDIDELLQTDRQYKSSSISVSRRRTDNTRVRQYPWVEDRQTIQEFINITDIDYLLYCLSVFYSQILMNSCIVCLSSTHRYWWTLVLSVCLLLTDSSSISVNRRQTDNTRVHQYLWVEDRQTIQEFINICE